MIVEQVSGSAWAECPNGVESAVMCAHYLFDPDFCNVAAGWEKGIVEKNVQDSRRRIWLDAQDCHFHSFEELNAWLGRAAARFGTS